MSCASKRKHIFPSQTRTVELGPKTPISSVSQLYIFKVSGVPSKEEESILSLNL